MSIGALMGAVLSAAMLSVFIKEYKREYSVFIGVCVSGIVIILLMPQIIEILDFIDSVAAAQAGLSEKIAPLIKAVGMALSVEIVADVCADAGENAMAKKIELAGKIGILLISIPVASRLLEIIKGILK